MEQNKDQFERSQQGTGSAENQDRDRSEQRSPHTKQSEGERQNVAGQIGEDQKNIADLKDLGALSGRDDSSGEDNDGLREQSTGEKTER